MTQSAAVEHPVARVLVDVGARQVDKPFDYLVPATLEQAAVVGARVRVRFSGRLVNGFILSRHAASEHEGELRDLERVLGPAVLTEDIAKLTLAVAQSYLGTWSDVVRSAVPPRHVEAEKLVLSLPPQRVSEGRAELSGATHVELGRYVGARQMAKRLAAKIDEPGFHDQTRVAWTVSPAVDGLELIASLIASLPGTTLVLVPEARSVGRFRQAILATTVDQPLIVEALDSSDTPRNRYTSFLKILRGEVDVVVGTRDALFAPVKDLTRIIVWDECSEHFQDQRSPRWHARRGAFMRSLQTKCDLVIAGHSRSLESAQLVASGWLKSIEALPDQRRIGTPEVVTEAAARAEDLSGARIPGVAWRAIKHGVARGPVLVGVPRAGYVRFLACAQCEEALECVHCGGVLEQVDARAQFSCAVCGNGAEVDECAECGSGKFKMATIGASRIVEELKRGFPRVTIVESSAKEGVLARVSAEPQIVVATTGAEPVADGRFQVSVVLDGRFSLLRTDLDAGENTLYRWMRLAAGTKPAEDGGALVLTGNPTNRIVQAVLRMDPIGWAAQELAERTELSLPPTNRFIELSAPGDELTQFLEFARPTLNSITGLRVVPSVPRDEFAVAFVTAPISQSKTLVKSLNELIRTWFGVLPSDQPRAQVASRQLRIEVDPVRL